MSTQKVYPEGLLGKKLGMSQIFTAAGECVPVTVVQAGPCFILEVKKQDKHGYSAVQLGFGPKKFERCTKAEAGHFRKANSGAFYHVEEMRCDIDKLGWTDPGKEIRVGEIFQDGELVDVTGTSIGRGFQGVVRRWHVKGQPATRGTHEYRRHIGAVGCRKFPGRIFKNKHMPGQMGNEISTIQNVEVVGVKADENLILIRGGIPGPKGALVVIRKAMKSYNKSKKAA